MSPLAEGESSKGECLQSSLSQGEFGEAFDSAEALSTGAPQEVCRPTGVFNPEKCAAAIDRSRKAKPEKYAALSVSTAGTRRARKLKATVPLTDAEKLQVRALYEKARALTKASGKKRTYHVDHIIPLARGGLHHPANLQILLGVDKERKGAK